VQTVRLGMKSGDDVRFERRANPSGRTYFWQVFKQIDDDVEGTDIWAFFHGYIAVTPMTLEVTAQPALKAFPALNLP
jgi:broad specificity polyphosphatase/5'/3'-nucleotidase SurE